MSELLVPEHAFEQQGPRERLTQQLFPLMLDSNNPHTAPSPGFKRMRG